MKISPFVLFIFCFSMSLQAQNIETPQNTRFYYTGSIVNVDDIQLNVYINELDVSGGLVMEDSGEHYFVEGRMASNKKGMGLRIYDDERNYFASIELNVISEEGSRYKQLIGVYKPRVDKKKKIVLTKIAEFANGQQTAGISNSRWSD